MNTQDQDSIAVSDAVKRNSHSPASIDAPVIVRELTSADRGKLLTHFFALGEEDRVLRFGRAVSDNIIEGYVRGIDFTADAAFGVFDVQLRLLGVVHLAYLPPDENGTTAELGISVLEEARGRGIGSSLLERAAIRSRNAGVSRLYIHCLSHNATMVRIARRVGMDISHAYGEADAYLTLPPANSASVFGEWLQEQVAVFDYAVKRQARDTRRMLGILK